MTKRTSHPNVAIYVRVSTVEQSLNGHSIGEQIDRLQKYCEANEWTIYEVYSDPGYSGGDTNRPALQKMLKDLSSHNISKVVVYKLDRLSRSQKDTLNLIEDKFLAQGVDFVSMSENFDTSTPFGRAMMGTLAVFAQLEREQIKERMAMGKEARAKEGKWNGGHHVAIGYDYIDDKLVVNDFEAMQVRLIFELLLKGTAPWSIANILNDKGYKNKNGLWHDKSVRRVLRSKTYLGYLKYNNTWYEADHEAIISEEVFNEAQKILQHRSEEHEKHNRRKGVSTTYFGGYLYCAWCGAKYTKHTGQHYLADGSKKYYPRFICNSRAKKHYALIKDVNCKNKIWNEADLNNQIFSEIKQLSLDPERFKELQPAAAEDRSSLITSELDKINSKIDKLMDLYLMDDMSKDILQDKLHEINDQKNNLEQELENIKQEQSQKLTREEAYKIIKDFQEVLERGTLEEVRTVIGVLIEKIEIDGDNITIFWNF